MGNSNVTPPEALEKVQQAIDKDKKEQDAASLRKALLESHASDTPDDAPSSQQPSSAYGSLLEMVVIIMAMFGQEQETAMDSTFSSILGFKNKSDFKAVKKKSFDEKLDADETRAEVHAYRKENGTTFDANAAKNLDKQAVLKSTNHPITTPSQFDKFGAHRSLLDLIAKGEHRPEHNADGSDYDRVYGSKNLNLTEMTVGEVLAWQAKRIKAGDRSVAAGRYQFINKTLKSMVKEHGIDLNRKFDENLQDELAIAKLKERGYDKFLRGDPKMPASRFQLKLSQEWASLAKNSNNMSYYAGDGLNQPKAKVKTNEIQSVLSTTKSAQTRTQYATTAQETTQPFNVPSNPSQDLHLTTSLNG